MSEFLGFAWELLAKVVYNVVAVVSSILNLLVFGWVEYFNIFMTYFTTFDLVGKIGAVILFAMLIAVPVLIVAILAHRYRIDRRLHRDDTSNKALYREIGRLNKQVLDLMDEKNKLLALKVNAMGGTKQIPLRARIMAATNEDLKKAVADGSFRGDLYYRLNVIVIRLPALKERTGDIPLLVARFIRELAEKNHVAVTGITPAALKCLEAYDWPGNVRELRNTIERMVVLSPGGLLDVADVPDEIQAATAPAPLTTPSLSPTVTLGENERNQILAVLKDVGGNRSRAAQVLGISRRTLYRKLDEYAREGITP